MPKKPRAARRTITREELVRLQFCNGKKLPWVIEMDGCRLQWVGIGWVNEGPPRGGETLVVD